MGRYVTVSVKIPSEFKERLERRGIKPSRLLKKVIMQELKEMEVERIKKEIEGLKPTLTKIAVKEVAESIREDRER